MGRVCGSGDLFNDRFQYGYNLLCELHVEGWFRIQEFRQNDEK